METGFGGCPLTEMAGHPGELETFNSVKQHYWWPGMQTFVKQYTQGCRICQQFKINRNPSHPSFILIEGSKLTRPFAQCSMDMITDLPLSNRYDSILAVVVRGHYVGTTTRLHTPSRTPISTGIRTVISSLI